MKPARDFWCEACSSPAKLPADADTIPRCPHCRRDNTLVLVSAPDGTPVTPGVAAAAFAAMRRQIDAETDPSAPGDAEQMHVGLSPTTTAATDSPSPP